MRKAKRATKRTPPPILTQGVDVLFVLDRRRKLARVARCEAACAEILRQAETDARRPYVGRMQRLLATARSNLNRGHRADWQMAQIEALAGRMNRAYLEPLAAHGQRMRQGRQRGGYSALRRVLEAYETAHPGARFSVVWDHLLKLQDLDDDTVQEVVDGSKKCHRGAHVHWIDIRGREQSSSEKAVQGLVGEIRKARRAAPPA